MRDRKNINKLLNEVDKCELCGNKRFLQVHHVLPISLGGTDEEENLIVICEKCHSVLHRGNHSTLTKVGVMKANKQHIVNQYKFYNKLYQLKESYGGKLTVEDILDLFDECVEYRCVSGIIKE